MSDRIAVMSKGHYEQLGDPETLYERPQTRFVAGFLGVSNLLTGRPDGTDDGHALVRLADDTIVRVPRRYVTEAGSIQIGVRPEKIRIHDPAASPPEQHNRLFGTVRDASYMGVSTQYQVELKNGSRITVYEQNVERAKHSELWAPGEQVLLTWSPDHTFVIAEEPQAADATAA